MKKFEFTATARKANSDFSEVGAWTDGIGVFSDGEEFCSYRLKIGKKYKVTIEEIKE